MALLLLHIAYLWITSGLNETGRIKPLCYIHIFVHIEQGRFSVQLLSFHPRSALPLFFPLQVSYCYLVKGSSSDAGIGQILAISIAAEMAVRSKCRYM